MGVVRLTGMLRNITRRREEVIWHNKHVRECFISNHTKGAKRCSRVLSNFPEV